MSVENNTQEIATGGGTEQKRHYACNEGRNVKKM